MIGINDHTIQCDPWPRLDCLQIPRPPDPPFTLRARRTNILLPWMFVVAGVAAAEASTPTWQVRPLAALALARIGDTRRAEAMVEEMERDNLSNTD